jgi:hypothetical protein
MHVVPVMKVIKINQYWYSYSTESLLRKSYNFILQVGLQWQKKTSLLSGVHLHLICCSFSSLLLFFDPQEVLSKMSVNQDENLHDNYESDEDNHETAGLLTSSSNGDRSRSDKRLRKVQIQGRLRPMELMQFKIPRKSFDGGSAISTSVFVFLLFSIGFCIWWWSGTQSEVALSVERWHKLKVDDIRSWCLNVS